MQLIAIMSATDKERFLDSYSLIANLLCAVQQIFSSFSLVLGLTFCMIYKSLSEDLMRGQHPMKREITHHYSMERLVAFVILIAWVTVHIEPKYTNQFNYFAADQVSDADFNTFRILNIIKFLSLIIAWFVSSNYKQASLGDVSLDPEGEEDEEGVQKSDQGSDDEET